MAASRGWALADALQVQQLESILAELAPKLARLTLQLRTAVLPAMSLLSPETAASLQVRWRDIWPLALRNIDSRWVCDLTVAFRIQSRNSIKPSGMKHSWHVVKRNAMLVAGQQMGV